MVPRPSNGEVMPTLKLIGLFGLFALLNGQSEPILDPGSEDAEQNSGVSELAQFDVIKEDKSIPGASSPVSLMGTNQKNQLGQCTMVSSS
jgi:hypothetical protein